MSSQDQPLTTLAGDEVPTRQQLDHMAFQGHSERVHSIFKRIPAAERGRYANRYVLSQVVRGGVARLRSTPREAAAVIEEEREFLAQVVALFVAHCRAESTFPRELFVSLLEWSRLLLDEARLADALDHCDLALDLGAKSFPDIYPQLLLHKADIEGALGRVAEAHATLLGLYERMDLVSDRNLVSRLTLELARTSLLTGQVGFFKRLLFDGLAAFYKSLDDRRRILALVRRTYRRSVRVLLSGETRPWDKLVYLVHWICLGGPARIAGRWLRYPLERGLLVGVYLGQYTRKGRRGADRMALVPAARAEEPRLLVTRAMGGLGDLLMLTPGLHALRLNNPRATIHLALPRRFFPLFEGNDDVKLLDIHGELDPAGYDRWFNLTDCPAARTESLTAPRVRRNRVEIFARALGVRGPALWRMDRRPRYFVSAEEAAWRDRFFFSHGLLGESVIGVQLRSDETYRDYPHMAALVQALARSCVVLLFDSRPIVGYDFANTLKVDGHGLRQAAALASGCRALVAPDSSFVHLAAALGLPAVGLFGPTDGAVRTSDYPGVRFVDVRRDLRCVPCWRNEEIPCALTGLRQSVCMAEIGPLTVAAAVAELIGETRFDRQQAGGGERVH
jgi:ADP-heptose:LPS heptosyltransferase